VIVLILILFEAFKKNLIDIDKLCHSFFHITEALISVGIICRTNNFFAGWAWNIVIEITFVLVFVVLVVSARTGLGTGPSAHFLVGDVCQDSIRMPPCASRVSVAIAAIVLVVVVIAGIEIHQWSRFHVAVPVVVLHRLCPQTAASCCPRDIDVHGLRLVNYGFATAIIVLVTCNHALIGLKIVKFG